MTMPGAPQNPTDPETEPYWAALREGRLLVKRCAACGEHHAYPRAGCPFCFAAETEWREASGDGEIYAVSAMRSPSGVSLLAYVTLSEGPTIMTGIADAAPEEAVLGRRVRLAVRPGADGAPAPMFVLA